MTKAGDFLATLKRGSAARGVPFPLALARSLKLYAADDFSRKEILGYALYDPQVRDALPVLISKERSLAKLAAINPPEHHDRTEEKDEFHRLCVRHGLPVPETFGWSRDGKAYDGDGVPFPDRSSWCAHLMRVLPAEFIAKDRAGAYGSGFRAFRREENVYLSAEDGRRLEAPALADLLCASDVIVQRRLYDDPRLAGLCGRRGLQTTRINTLLTDDGRVAILFWMIKVLAGHTLSDNFSMGTTGNLIAFGDPGEDGVLRAAVTIHPSGSGLVRIESHPATGVSFGGFRLPWWEEAKALVTRGQRCFPELPTLGWDVALTAHGPVIVEANARWDPPAYAPFLMSREHWVSIFDKGRRPGGGPVSRQPAEGR